MRLTEYIQEKKDKYHLLIEEYGYDQNHDILFNSWIQFRESFTSDQQQIVTEIINRCFDRDYDSIYAIKETGHLTFLNKLNYMKLVAACKEINDDILISESIYKNEESIKDLMVRGLYWYCIYSWQ